MDKKEWVEEFGRNLQLMIREEGITQKQLAEESGIRETDISRYVNGKKAPGYKAIVNISYALSREIDELMDFGEMIE